ncbi:MAG: iron ABC transporter permease [Blautia sp.]|nr:iron ABC transporter permease [Blautia sp.]
MKKYLPLKKKSQFYLFCGIMAAAGFAAMIAAMLLGSVGIQPDWVVKILANHLSRHNIFSPEWEANKEAIIWTLRAPRVVMAYVTGAGLSLCGILMQALTKNSLADPYVLGISSGASSGAVAVICYGWFRFAGAYHIMFGATLGAILAIVIAMKVSSVSNKVTATQLVLAGIAVQAMFSAITNAILYSSTTTSDKLRSAMHWMVGSLASASWNTTVYVLIISLVCTVIIRLFHTELDVLMLGDDTASTLGINLRQVKIGVIVLCTALTGSIVSIGGVIGFVGLLVPHITRSIVGSAHKRLIPASVLTGGFFVVICDMLARILAAPEELPIGVITSFFGAPFFLFLIRKSRNSFGGKNG